jgi:hypothetical protein
VAWFRRLADLMRENRSLHEHLGTVDCVAQFSVLDAGPGDEPWRVQVTFDGFEVTDVREVTDEADVAHADFIVETDLDVWRDMIRSIAAGNGRPALDQTLNYLSLPGTPIRVWSDDPVRRDAFFRFNQSLQELFNASAAFPTKFPEDR